MTRSKQHYLPQEIPVSRTTRTPARLLTRGDVVRFIHQPPSEPAGHHVIYLYDQDNVDMGTLVWQVCSRCRRGIINKISIAEQWQRRGLGRRLIARALREGPGYTWSTFGQSPGAKTFFAIMTLETGSALTDPGQACAHMNPTMPRALPVSRSRAPGPTVELDI
jgi:GNAT superfamily N-acetyltransferase